MNNRTKRVENVLSFFIINYMDFPKVNKKKSKILPPNVNRKGCQIKSLSFKEFTDVDCKNYIKSTVNHNLKLLRIISNKSTFSDFSKVHQMIKIQTMKMSIFMDYNWQPYTLDDLPSIITI